ncbi:MAG: hybrid sensor histidine kinase/response regulator, partial [Fusicatenibacter saccharivorans]
MRLLLAEDEKEMAHALEAVFTHNHYSVDVVYNGIDAADWAESGNYDGMILDIMMPGKSGLEVLSEWTESIHHQIERLNSLVTQLLTLAKMEEGGGELELKTWNASETIMDAVTSFEAPAVTKQIALQSDIAEEVYMEGDAARIHQLVSLLVDNAVKYTPEG